MKYQQILFTNEVQSAVEEVIRHSEANRVFFLTDNNTQDLAEQHLKNINAFHICIPPGDIHKNLSTAQTVWAHLQEKGATRKSLLVNIGGGVVTDLGGFAAATFKRGIRFVNVPTTLLGAVDAAVGGKTGINFNGLKNEIGVFREADSVIISSLFFGTLPEKELKSGYAEMIKHGLLENTSAYRDLTEYDFSDTTDTRLLSLLRQSVETKRRIVDADPYEKGVRRALNLGHTAGHAFESMAMQRQSPVPHGYAVAWGLVVEAVISHLEKGFPSSTLYHLAAFVLRHYGTFHITCDDYPELLRLMRHDKKSENGEYNFSLLKEIGEVETGCHVTGNTVEAALDIFRDLMHI